MKDALIVTRHPALIRVLAEDFDIWGEVITHATPEQVRGRKVVGVLPLHLAAETQSVTEVVLDIPADKRGVELSADEVRQYCKGLRTFVVRDIQTFNLSMEEAWECGQEGVPPPRLPTNVTGLVAS
jgi:putative CRISPR-associated protein (TIGR02620 family)